MTMPLYTGVVGDWYKLRLQHMFKHRPKCKLLYSFNHLMGTCPNCGPGRYASSRNFRLMHYPIDRQYVMLARKPTDLERLKSVVARGGVIFTNAEYPLPLIRLRTYVHVPMFYDPVCRTVIDYLPKTNDRSKIISMVEEELDKAGLFYSVFDDTGNVYKSRSLRDSEAHDMHLLSAMRGWLSQGGRR